jgi:hypothetical protein
MCRYGQICGSRDALLKLMNVMNLIKVMNFSGGGQIIRLACWADCQND